MNFAVRLGMRSTLRLSLAFIVSTLFAQIASAVGFDPTDGAVSADEIRQSTSSSFAPGISVTTVSTSDGLETEVPTVVKDRTSTDSSTGNDLVVSAITSVIDETATKGPGDGESTRPSNITGIAGGDQVHEIPTEKASAPDVASQHSPDANTATPSVEATSDGSVYNASSLEPATRNDTPAVGPFEKVFLRNYTEFQAFKDRLTHRRRTRPSNQLECIAGCGDVFPNKITCTQRDNNASSVQWRCFSELPDNVTLVIVSLDCEGYERPNDEFVTRDSCRVRFSLQNRAHIVRVKEEHEQHPHHTRFNPEVLNPSNDDFLILPYLIPAVVLVGGIILVVMVFTCFCPREKEESAVPPVTTYQQPPQPQFQQPPMSNASPMALQQQSFQNPHSNPHPFASPNFNPGYPAPMQPGQYGAYPNAPPMAYPQQNQYPPGVVPQQPYPQAPTQVIQQPARSGGGVASGIGGFVAGAAAGGLAGYAINSMMHQNHSGGDEHATSTTTTTNVDDQNIDVIAEYPGGTGGMYGDVEDQPAYGTTTTSYVEPNYGATDTYVAPTYDAEDTYTQPTYDDGGDDFGGGDYD